MVALARTCFAVAVVATLLAPLPTWVADKGGEVPHEIKLAVAVCLRVALVSGITLAYLSVPMIRALWVYREIPGPWPLPVIGNILSVRKGNPDEVYERWEKQYGPVFKWFLGSKVTIVLNEFGIVREIGLRNFSSFMNHSRAPEHLVSFFPKPMQNLMNKGLFASQGMYWKGIRSTASSIFHSAEKLEAFHSLMSATANELADRLGDLKDGEVVDIWRALGDMTLDVIGSTIFGVRFNAVQTKSNDAVKAARIVFANSGLQVGSNPYLFAGIVAPPLVPILRRLANAYPNKRMKDMNWAAEVLAGLSYQMAEEAAAPETGSVPEGRGAGTPSGVVEYEHIGQSFLKLFAQAHNRETGKSLSKHEVSAQGFLFLLAGYETTATALALGIYLLSKNKEKEEELIKEIDRLANSDLASLDDLKEYEYVEAVVKEALRMHGPVAFMDRVATHTTKVRDYVIHQGTDVHFGIRNMHWNPDYFPSPENFLPERFITGSNIYAEQSHKAFMPWGLGPRMCVAANFALMEAKLALITLYRRYRFSLDPAFKLKTKMGATVVPANGIQVLVAKRTLARDDSIQVQ